MKCNISTQSSDGFNGDLGLDIHLHDIVSKEGSFEDILYHMLLSAKLSFSKTIASMNTLNSFHFNIYIHNAKGNLNVENLHRVKAAYNLFKGEEGLPYENKMYFSLSIQDSDIENIDLDFLVKDYGNRSLEIINSNVYNINTDYYRSIEIKESEVELNTSLLYIPKEYKDKSDTAIYAIDENSLNKIKTHSSIIRGYGEAVYRHALMYLSDKTQTGNLILTDMAKSYGIQFLYHLIRRLDGGADIFTVSNSNIIIRNSLLNVVALFAINNEINFKILGSSPIISMPIPGAGEFTYFYWDLPSMYYNFNPTDKINQFL